MNVLKTANALRKARKAQSDMKNITAVGKSKSGLTAMLINGLNEIEEIQFEDQLLENINSETLEKEVIQAFSTARKDLESQLASSMDLDSIRDMLGV